jgi:hypothetical protein
MDDNIQELYSLLRTADQRAQTGDAQAQKDAQSIYDHIQHLEKTQKQQSAAEYPPLLAGGIGESALIGGKVAKFANAVKDLPTTVKDIATSQQQHNQVLSDLIKQNQTMQNRGVAQPHGGSTWTEKMSGIAPEGSFMGKQSKDVADRMVSAIQPNGPAAGGSISPSGNIILTPDIKAERQAAMALREAKIADELKKTSLLGKASKYGGMLAEMGGKALTKANPYLQAFSIPYETADAYNKFNRDDNVGGALSTIGAVSGAASLYPPLTIPAGLTSLGAHGADIAYQEYLRRRGQPQQGNEQQPAQYAIGGLVFRR